MQSKLPDINAALVRYRSLAIDSFQNHDDESARMALGNIVALLPEEFKVVVNTEEYREKIKEKNFMVCLKCKKEIPYNEINKVKKRLSNLEQFVKMCGKNPPRTADEKEYDMVWDCPKCKHENRLDDTQLITEKPNMPFYLGVIPEPPKHNYSDPLTERMYFTQRFREWFKIAFAEIESKIGIYRAEYQSQNPDNKDDFGSKE